MASPTSSTSSTSTVEAPNRSQGQGALYSRASLRGRSSASNFVQRQALREVSGQSMHLILHQHFGFRMHCEWNGAFGTRIFESHFKGRRGVSAFCAAINAHTLEGVSSCIMRHDTLFDSWMLMHDKISICRVPPRCPTGPRGIYTSNGRGRRTGYRSGRAAVGQMQLNGLKINKSDTCFLHSLLLSLALCVRGYASPYDCPATEETECRLSIPPQYLTMRDT
jgi:hypothetical protein